MEERKFKSCILETAGKLQELRNLCEELDTPEALQDGYEDIIDKLLGMLGATTKQREFFWSLTDPE